MAVRLIRKTPLDAKIEDVRFACSACGKEFRYVPAYGNYRGLRGAGTYLITRFNKHVHRYHKEAA